MRQSIPTYSGLLLLVILAFLNIRQSTPPAVVPDTTPTASFSAERALRYLKVIAAEPHTGGTPAHQQVGDYLLETFASLGLDTAVQKTTVVDQWNNNYRLSRVRNILARRPGSDPSLPAILLLSHYDSQVNTPGAADDGAGVAAILETLRALQGESLDRTLLVLISDQEEMGLLGAEGFIREHPWIDSIALLLNLEARGNQGPSLSFEFSSNNGWLIEQWAQAAPFPMGNSLAFEIYKRMPNGTDFTPFREAGIPGINAALLNGYRNYHAATDTPENLDLRSLQHHGSNLLALTRHFAQKQVEYAEAPDRTFFNAFGQHMVHYGPRGAAGLQWVNRLFLLLLLYLMLVRTRRISAGGVAVGALSVLLTLVLAVGLHWLLVMGVGIAYPHYQAYYLSGFYNVNYYVAALVTLLPLVGWLTLGVLDRKISREALLLGATVLLGFLAEVLVYTLPSGAYLLAIPFTGLLLAQLLHALSGWVADKNAPGYFLLLTLGLIPTVLLWPLNGFLFYLAFGLPMPFGATVMWTLQLIFLWPLLGVLNARRRSVLPVVSLGITGVLLLMAHLNSGTDAEHPAFSDLSYFLDTDSGKAYWYTYQKEVMPWDRDRLAEAQPTDLSGLYFGNAFTRPAQVATAINYAPATLQITADTLLGNGNRRITGQLSPNGTVNRWRFKLADARQADSLWLDGRMLPLDVNRDSTIYITMMAPAPTGLAWQVDLKPGVILDLQANEQYLEWPAALKNTMPPMVLPAYWGNHWSVSGRYRIGEVPALPAPY
ncbi:MAG: M28 family peptidase [Lewinellaceae bacterium]|nr:M28 family peptidase [Lewinellaceae bacterium]